MLAYVARSAPVARALPNFGGGYAAPGSALVLSGRGARPVHPKAVPWLGNFVR